MVQTETTLQLVTSLGLQSVMKEGGAVFVGITFGGLDVWLRYINFLNVSKDSLP
jgi:hypothetical protein